MDDLFDHSVEYPFPPTTGEPAPPAETAGVASDEHQPAKPGKPPDPLPGTGGIYLLTDGEDRIIQLASAGNLRRAIQMRLAGQADGQTQAPGVPLRRRADLSQIVRKIRWRTAYSAFEISLEYYRLARVLLPDAYLKQLAFGPAWFVHADAASAIPRFLAGKILRSPPGVDLGPFFTHAEATRFVQVIEDGFDLCRYYQILEQAPRGKACAYFAMGRCPGPCDGSIPMSRYQETIADALAFATGDREAAYGRYEAAMREAAGRQAYEEAGRIKQRMERLREIEHKAFARVGPIERFNWLIVQRGGGTTKVKPFFVRAGVITPGEAVALKQLDTAAEKWSEAIATGGGASMPTAVPPDRQQLSEQIWLVSHFLGKRDPRGLFLKADQLPRPADLATTIRDYFRKPEPPAEPEPPAAAAETNAPPSPL